MTAMTETPNLDTATAADVPAANPAQDLLTNAKAVAKTVDKLTALDDTLADMHIKVKEAREAVTVAMDANGDFKAAIKTFQQLNNKMDKTIEQREKLIESLHTSMDEVRDTLAAVSVQVRGLDN